MEKGQDSKSIIVENSLTPYELAIFNGMVQTKASKAAHEKVISDAVSNVLSAKASNGNESSELTVAEVLVIKTVTDAINNPSTGKLKDLATIVGDVAATKVEVATSSVDQELAKDAIGEDKDNGEE